ncbi:dihydrofolate synthetase [Cocos nucifera]|uniref:Dihydrofolate synthetase n=1 Tax=Cocos nucifera TaxID=13894 RepID=A0A8K0I400_COCNU|nr:dihydrofolate synthetase [Cocos nucifera]
MSEDPELGDFLDYMEKLKNYERSGVPRGAGTDSDDGFDLGRMRRLLQRLGNPHTQFKAKVLDPITGYAQVMMLLSITVDLCVGEVIYRIRCVLLIWKALKYLIADFDSSILAFFLTVAFEHIYPFKYFISELSSKPFIFHPCSPHLLTIRERISLGRNGDPVPAEVLKNVFHQVKGILDQSMELEHGALTHFEVFTALAFFLFSQAKVDIAIIEAGLGGARDATNVICNTELAAAVITSVGEEHLAALGGSLESIAMAKSGIIKHGCPVVYHAYMKNNDNNKKKLEPVHIFHFIHILFEVVIGGPFEPHIEHIIRDRAFLMKSPVISSCDPGIRSALKFSGRSIDLPNLKLRMLGNHQLLNVVTATCTALCLHGQGLLSTLAVQAGLIRSSERSLLRTIWWKVGLIERELLTTISCHCPDGFLKTPGWAISDESIRAGLERTKLLGRSQFLTQDEASAIGLSGTSILIDGAHTEASAKGLADVIRMIHPDGALALVVAMASDKDHLAFAKQLLSDPRPEVVLLTEVTIAGGKSRIASASTLKDVWIRAALDLGIDFMDIGVIDHGKTLEVHKSESGGASDHSPAMLVVCHIGSVSNSIKAASQLLQSRTGNKPSVVVATGSLHVVSSVLAAVHH